MTQEDKDLLLRDLSSRLLYKVVAQVSYKDGEGWKTQDRKVLGVYTDEQVYVDGVYTDIENTKPYLRPMSSMTKEEIKEFYKIENLFPQVGYICPSQGWLFTVNGYDWLNAHHFDYRGLIEKGIALEALEGMYN